MGVMSEIVTLDFEEILAGLNDKSLTYLDVRNRTELQSDGKVAGSVNIPLPEINEAFEDKYGFPKPAKTTSNVVVACKSGVRALTALKALKSIGYESFSLYRGSFNDWQAKGGPIVKN